jgi:cation:H+ antiporter
MTLLSLLLGLTLLLAGGVALVSGASGLASRLGVSPLLVGLTVVAFGTSAPELVVNLLGALRGATELAFGNVAGSNLANLGLVLGSAAILRPVTIEGQIVRRELPLLLLVTAILAVMVSDRVLQQDEPLLSRSDGLILLLLFSIFIYFSIVDFVRSRNDTLLENILELEQTLPRQLIGPAWSDYLALLGGMIGLGLGGHLTIIGGMGLAEVMDVSPVVVGLLVVAVGTSMPELVTSVIAALKNESDLCLGNVVGSNIFNALFVLPITAVVRPLPIPAGGLVDILASLAFALLVMFVFLVGRARMARWVGLAFVGCYLAYMLYRVTA